MGQGSRFVCKRTEFIASRLPFTLGGLQLQGNASKGGTQVVMQVSGYARPLSRHRSLLFKFQQTMLPSQTVRLNPCGKPHRRKSTYKIKWPSLPEEGLE